MSVVKDITISPLNVKMKNPFITALGSKTVSKNIVVRVLLENGTVGTGEGSASLALPDETQNAMTQWLLKKKSSIVGKNIEEFNPLKPSLIIKKLWREDHPTALGAIECALFNALAKENKKTMASFFGRGVKQVETDITLSAWNTATTIKVAQNYHKQGFRRFKIKVGKSQLSEEIQRLNDLMEAAPACQFWIDANQGFSLETFKRFLAAAEKYHWPVVAMEQPTPKDDFLLLKRAQDSSPWPVYADESAGSWEDVKKLIKIKAAKGIVIKIAKTGLSQGFRILEMARDNGLQTMLSSMAESAQGILPSVQWAIGDGKFNWVDVDSFMLTEKGPGTARLPFAAKGPFLSLAR